jgi:hypothetical protein
MQPRRIKAGPLHPSVDRLSAPVAFLEPPGRKYEAPEGYNARHDPDYPDRLLNDLVDHKWQWRALHRLFGGDFETVREAVAMGRRIGLQIEGDHDHGYRYVGFRRIRKVRVAKASAWPQGDQGGSR